MLINKSCNSYCQSLFYDLYTVISPSDLLGFDASSLHSGQALFDSFQPAPKIRRLSLEPGLDRFRLNPFSSPAWSEADGIPSASAEAEASAEAALRAAPAAGSESSSITTRIGFGILWRGAAKP
jgi:hypothetical protein